MILTAHQPVYIPWLGLFHKIALADRFVSFNQVQYQPKDWNNRNQIKTAAGPSWLSVPVRRSGYLDKIISDIEIDSTAPWQRKHWKSIEVNYRKAPYFSRYADFFEDVFLKKEWTHLVTLNEYMLAWFLDTLGITTPILSAGDFDFSGQKSGLVLDMCVKLGAHVYVFGAQGKNYADTGSFLAQGVQPVFQSYVHPEYPQMHGSFAPNLSIVDLLFNCGPSSLDILMSGNIGKTDLAAAAGNH